MPKTKKMKKKENQRDGVIVMEMEKSKQENRRKYARTRSFAEWLKSKSDGELEIY